MLAAQRAMENVGMPLPYTFGCRILHYHPSRPAHHPCYVQSVTSLQQAVLKAIANHDYNQRTILTSNDYHTCNRLRPVVLPSIASWCSSSLRKATALI